MLLLTLANVFTLLVLINGSAIPQKFTLTRPADPESISNFPWLVSVQVGDYHLCAGAIISETWILTVDHCMMEHLPWFTVRVGSSAHDQGGQKVRVADCLPHPLTDDNLLRYDFALIKLAEPLKFTEFIKPIALSSVEPAVNSVAEAIGFGGEAVCRDVVHIFDRKECTLFGEPLWPETLCVGPHDPETALCLDDEDFYDGSALVKDGKLIGLLSVGSWCPESKGNLVFANVADKELYNWVEQKIKE